MSEIVYMSLQDAKDSYEKYSHDDKKIYAIVVYKNGFASIKPRSEIEKMKIIRNN